MADERVRVARVELLLEALFLERGTDVSGTVGDAALQWVVEALRLDPWSHFGTEQIAHLVAIQLAPREAIRYATANPVPRWRLVDAYLSSRYDLAEGERQDVARLVATILDAADLGRRGITVPRDRAVGCAICRLPFGREPASVRTRDPYKPIWQAPVELTQPEVDHVVPISGLGRHRPDNLQLVCRACNVAKSDGLTIDPRVEVRYAATDIARVPRIHLFRLLQWLIVTKGDSCSICGTTQAELTMRPIYPDAPLARAVMAVRCYECVSTA